MRQFINKLYTDIYSFKHKNMYAQKKIYKQNSIASLIKKRSNATSNRMRSSPPVIDKLLECKQKLDLFNRIITNENLHTSNIEEIVDNSKLSSSSSSSTSSKKKRKSKNKTASTASASSMKVKKESTTTKKKGKKVTFADEEDDALVKELEELFGDLEQAKPDDMNDDNKDEEELKEQEDVDVDVDDVYIDNDDNNNNDVKDEEDDNNNNNTNRKGNNNNNKNKLQNNVKTLLKISSDIYETCINMCKKHVRQCEDLIERNKRNELVIEEQDHKLAIIEKSILNQFRSLYDGVIRIDTPYIHSRRDMMTNDISVNPFK